MDTTERTPSVLFVYVKNAGKSQMAAGLTRKLAGDSVVVHSPGANPGKLINELSAETLTEVGIDISTETPNPSIPNSFAVSMSS
jgi:arsenate-mycothiol transferase